MNDSNEFVHAFDIATEIINNLKSRQDNEKTNIICDQIIKSINVYRKLNIFVACFSEKCDSLNQWRGYTTTGNGYCLGLNKNELERQAYLQDFSLLKCIYDDLVKRQIFNQWASDLINHLRPILDTEINNIDKSFWENSISFMQQFVNYAATMKDKAFIDEEEWRLVSIKPNNHEKVGLRVGKSLLVPYFPIELDFSIENKLLWDITIGPTPQIELALDSISFLHQKIWLQNGITKTQIPYRDW